MGTVFLSVQPQPAASRVHTLWVYRHRFAIGLSVGGRQVRRCARTARSQCLHGSLSGAFSNHLRSDAARLTKQLYNALLRYPIKASCRHAARRYLNVQLASAATLESDLPDNFEALNAWLRDNTARVGGEYRD